MKLIQFSAEGVHGYLDFNLKFNPDVNFIAGLNGSGKTTALNLIAALLTPSLEDLAKIEFKWLKLTFSLESEKVYSIHASQNNETLQINIDGETIPDSILVNIQELKHSQERSITNKFRPNGTFKFIIKIPSPMYLSLDRRFIKEISPFDSSSLSISFNTLLQEKISKGDTTADSGMKEALDLIFKKSAELKDKQTAEDRQLRNKIILDSFFIEKNESVTMTFPDHKSLQQLKTKQKTIKAALINLDFKNEELEQMYDRFFESLTAMLKNALEVINNQIEGGKNKTYKHPKEKRRDSDLIPQSHAKKHEPEILSLESSRVLGSWFSNSHQMARIDRLIKLIGDYETVKTQLYQPLMKFVNLVNSFLEQTGKKISVTSRGEVRIYISGEERPLTVLSSGERQILIMLAHLSLNAALPKSGVFIVDEPELSLHIAWQDMFLEAVQAAGPDLQIILATHSPAIIGGRKKFYIPLNGGI